jgi:hypothetical protein
MLRLIEQPGQHALLHVPAATRAVVSWNAVAPNGALALIAHRVDGSVSEPLLYVRWSPDERRSLDGADPTTGIAVDVVRSEVPLSGIEVTSTVPLDAVAVATPPPRGASAPARQQVGALDVPPLAQDVAAYPQARGRWCSAAALAMLLRFHGIAADVAGVAHGVEDAAYGGTGNWAFNVAYAGAHGLRGVVAYLRGLDHVGAFLAVGLPVAISIAWERGQLPGVPLERSEGHLLVVRGLEPSAALVHDPAHPDVATSYPRAALERAFRGHGGVAYLVAPRERSTELVVLTNDPAA